MRTPVVHLKVTWNPACRPANDKAPGLAICGHYFHAASFKPLKLWCKASIGPQGIPLGLRKAIPLSLRHAF